MTRDNYTRWAVIAAGEGGGRMAVKYFERDETSAGQTVQSCHENPGIEDRIMILNTNRPDMRNAIDTIQSTLADEQGIREDRGDGTDTTEDVKEGRYAATFGPLDGVGNDFSQGEMCAKKGFDRVVNRIDAAGIDVAQAFLYYTTLGGGTGNGTVPYLIHQLKHSPPTEAFKSPNIAHIAFGAWPYDHNGAQQHHNAVCGLSRLLKWYDGKQNADMVLLASNTHIAETLDDHGDAADRLEKINGWIRTAVDLLVAAGRDATRVVDTQDLVTQPSNLNDYHFTPGISTENKQYLDLSLMFERAQNTFVPADTTTASSIYAVVRAPEMQVERGEYTQERLSKELAEWLEANEYTDIKHRNQTIVPHQRRDDNVDVLLLFGGFDLMPLLEESVDGFRSHYERAIDRGSNNQNGHLDPDDYRRIKQNLETYIDEPLW